MKICSVDGCRREHRGYGLCRIHQRLGPAGVDRVCEHCRRGFRSENKEARFCSPSCKSAAWTTPARECSGCARLLKLQARGLCNNCYMRWRYDQRAGVACEKCGQPCAKRARFCSRACAWSSRKISGGPCRDCGEFSRPLKKERCERCYQKAWRQGPGGRALRVKLREKASSPPTDPKFKCSVPGCETRRKCHGLCQRHDAIFTYWNDHDRSLEKQRRSFRRHRAKRNAESALYYWKNRERELARRKPRTLAAVRSLSDGYVRSSLLGMTGAVPRALIEAKRAQVKLLRLAKEKSK